MRLEAEAWRPFFDSYAQEAFRLETLPSYGVASEDEELQSFLSTGQLDIPDDDPWVTRVRHFRATDRWVGRVHMLQQPLSDYLRYEFAVYGHTVRASTLPITRILTYPVRTSGCSTTPGWCA